VQFVHQASHHRLPAIYTGREFSEIGGMMSYGTNIVDAFRQAGVLPVAFSRAPNQRDKIDDAESALRPSR
jgi:hypothetical protein